MPVSALSTPNIALIKYWGNRNDELRLPMADSLSMTLDQPHVTISADHAESLVMRSFKEDGTERELKEKDIARYRKHLDLTKRYLALLGAPDAIPDAVSLSIRSHIPPAVGLASSAAVFSCLARAYAGLVRDAIELGDTQVSVIARLGSGSATRSIFGGYEAFVAGRGEAIDSAYGEQIADEHHWILHNVILIPSQEEKKVGSTEGHALAHTSPHYHDRLRVMARRQQECIDAILQRDFEKLQHVAEEDCMDMHLVMQTSTPPLRYLTEETHRIICDITALRESDHIPVLYTMDAGPTVHLFCTEEGCERVLAFAESQESCTLFHAKVGPGARLIDAHGSALPSGKPAVRRAMRGAAAAH